MKPLWQLRRRIVARLRARGEAGGTARGVAGDRHVVADNFREPQGWKGRGEELNRRVARITLYCVGGLLLFVAAVAYAKEFALGWALSRTAVGMIVGGIGCLWVGSEL